MEMRTHEYGDELMNMEMGLVTVEMRTPDSGDEDT